MRTSPRLKIKIKLKISSQIARNQNRYQIPALDQKIRITSKNVSYTYDLLVDSITNARKVEKPPLNTAPPISPRALFAFSFLVPS